MNKPVEAIDRMRKGMLSMASGDLSLILAYLDSPPDHVVEWPKELTREHLTKLCDDFPDIVDGPTMNAIRALRALAEIAPEAPKKRMVEIWETGGGTLTVLVLPINADKPTSWRKVGGPVEIE